MLKLFESKLLNSKKQSKMNENLNKKLLLKEKLEVLPIEDLVNLKKIYGNSSPLLNELSFKDLSVIYCDDFRDTWKLLTQTECTCKLSKLTRSLEIVINYRQFIRKLELIGDLTPVFNTTNFFEEFENLELLELFDKSESKPIEPEAYTLKLKKLKKFILHFYCEPERINNVTLETPSLDWLRLNFDPSKLTIIHPETIETLEFDELFPNFYLPNLNYIWLSSFFNYRSCIFDQFPKLLDFHFLDSDESSINNLLNQLKTTNKSLNIYQNNILINGIGLMDSYSVILDYNLLNIYKKYESRLVNRLHFIKDIQLTFDLKEIPKSFFKRMSCLSHIKVSHKLDDLELWRLLLKSCMKLGSIRLKTKIDQKFLELIPKFAPTINRLIIDYEVKNLEFVNSLKELTYLSIEQELPIQFFKQWVKSYNFVKIIQFYHNDKQCTVEFLDDKVYFGNVLCEVLVKPLDELVEDLPKYKSWNNIFKEMTNFLELDYKQLNNLAYKIDIEPEVNFSKLLK